MRYALDTMVVSEPRKARPHGALLEWIAAHSVAAFGIPAIVFFELQRGAELTRRQDHLMASQLDAWVEDLIISTNILPFTPEIARETARLLRRRSPDLFADAAIAATARVHGLTVATRNTKDFKQFNVPMIDPFVYGRQ